jgi:hypothetical protein
MITRKCWDCHSDRDTLLCMTSLMEYMCIFVVQERIATAFSLGSVAEARLWLTEWTSFCCKVSDYSATGYLTGCNYLSEYL